MSLADEHTTESCTTSRHLADQERSLLVCAALRPLQVLREYRLAVETVELYDGPH